MLKKLLAGLRCSASRTRNGVGDAELATRLSAAYAGDPIGGGGKHILVACMPKSASTFLTHVIGHVPGFRVVGLPFGNDRREQELDFFQATLLHDCHYVTQAHVRYSRPTGLILQTFNIFPIVLVRNIFDCVVSLRDHLCKESLVAPCAYFDQRFLEASRVDQLDQVIDLAVPWYVNFLACWSQYQGPALRVSFEEVVRGPEIVASRALGAVGHEAPLDEIEAAVARARSGPCRFNIGASGRGTEQLSALQIDRIRKLLSYYSHLPGVEDIMKQ